MSLFMIDKNNNKLTVSALDDSIVIPNGLYTEKELQQEIKKQFNKFRERRFILEWDNGASPKRMISPALGLN